MTKMLKHLFFDNITIFKFIVDFIYEANIKVYIFYIISFHYFLKIKK